MKIVLFTALWCADCIVMRPRWTKAFATRPDISVVDFDFDDNESEAKKYAITRVPQLLIIDEDNNELERLEGMQDQETLTVLINKYF